MTMIVLNDTGEPKYKQLAALVARDIVSGKIMKGDLLPPILDMANVNGVSLDVILDAYKYLETLEIVGMDLSRKHVVINTSKAFYLVDGNYF